MSFTLRRPSCAYRQRARLKQCDGFINLRTSQHARTFSRKVIGKSTAAKMHPILRVWAFSASEQAIEQLDRHLTRARKTTAAEQTINKRQWRQTIRDILGRRSKHLPSLKIYSSVQLRMNEVNWNTNQAKDPSFTTSLDNMTWPFTNIN